MTDRDSAAALRGQACLDPAIVDMMKALVTGQTDEALNDRFGISYNSWRKLIAGRPVRHSLAQRVTQRVIMIASSS
ncbi:hypothetical protein [Sphingobium sp. YR768]|jgi:hypothetical protein|uniref:hypothetical protein n=1 Tax=Sphingobium sp. YR768 TaxID=1884365 RepID=UPI0008B5D2B3|nr:hypothetical protein [Sphingobium sp. YR768]SER88832.1 hypothetical protein SAMN05518866_12331 [Sphingobium sp. YR768]